MNFEHNFDFRKFYQERDNYYWQTISELIKKKNLTIETILKNYMSFIQRRDLPQLLAYYELFKLIENLPGSIVEGGVYLGNGLFTWAKLLETFCPGNRGRKVYGFDNFKGYEDDVEEVDENAVTYIKNVVGHFKADEELVQNLVKICNLDNLVPGVERVKLFTGDFITSLHEFETQEIGVRISLLVADVNLYQPTKLFLDRLYPKIVKGGIIMLRGYGVKPWEGESQAVDEFIQENKISKINNFPFSTYPAIYFTKD